MGKKKTEEKREMSETALCGQVNLVAADRLDVKSVDVGLHRDVFVQ